MNKFQKLTIVFALIFVTFSTILVPWQYTSQLQGLSQMVEPAGYHFIFSPPERKANAVRVRYGVRIDYKLYLMQMFGGLFVFGGLYIILKNNEID